MIVLDTSLIVAAMSPKDKNHQRAERVLAEIRAGAWGRALLPDWVVVEVLNFVLRKHGRAHALRKAAEMVGTVDSAVVPCSPLFSRAMEIFTAPKDAGLSLADAGIVAVAEAHRVRNIATFDGAFRAFPALNIVDDGRRSA